MGKSDEGSNSYFSNKKSNDPTVKVSLAILIYVLIVALFRFLGYCYHNNDKLASDINNLAYKEENKERKPALNNINNNYKNTNYISDNQSFKSNFRNKKTKKRATKKELKKSGKKRYFKKEKKYLIELQNLNKTDSSQLILIKGIGAKYASRIVKYREKLGGYISKLQLKEVYGMTDENYQRIAPILIIDSTFTPIKIRFLSCDFKRLLSHPYCDYKMAKRLFSFRYKMIKNKGKESRVNGDILLNINDIDTIKLKKLLPYLLFE